jgi:hypothetical protein
MLKAVPLTGSNLDCGPLVNKLACVSNHCRGGEKVSNADGQGVSIPNTRRAGWKLSGATELLSGLPREGWQSEQRKLIPRSGVRSNRSLDREHCTLVIEGQFTILG